jgi:spermidine/putrescine transport system substrate-binding protein
MKNNINRIDIKQTICSGICKRTNINKPAQMLSSRKNGMKAEFSRPIKFRKHISFRRHISLAVCLVLLLGMLSVWTPSENKVKASSTKSNTSEKEITLRVCNWEEYIDLGDWDEEEVIELDNGEEILGVNTLTDDFEEWYYETYGAKVNVEYSCFGTNEDLYNMLTLGDVYDLVCPSDYMIMKLMAEEQLVPFSDEFFDETNENNYYVNGVSPYIRETFDENEINGESWSKYAAGYMWGLTGILYNPEKITDEEAETWEILNNPKFARQVTIKDNVRDSYFAALGILYRDKLTDEDFINSENYHEELTNIMNDVSTDTINQVQDLLQDMKDNVYSFETDSGKADMVSGKVLANYQWSGDAVYAMDQAEEDGLYLNFAVPEESTNLWFDGWVMLKSGIGEDAEKQQAAEAFVNYLSRPDNAVRNMYYIGYTSVISGGDNDTVFEYLNWCYGAEEDEEDVVEYPLGYFFSGDNSDEDYIITAPAEQIKRQLYAQYPDEDAINRSAIMQYFDDSANKEINQMWINVRCFNIKDVSPSTWLIIILIIITLATIITVKKLRK